MSSDAAGRAGADFDAASWAAAAQGYAEADRIHPLSGRELERWGLAAYLAGHDEESDAARERAFHTFLSDRDIEGAARVGHWLGVTLFVRGEPARGGGWHGRVQALLDEHHMGDSVWQTFLRASQGMRLFFGGQAAAAAEHFEQVLVEATAHEEVDLAVVVRNGLGQSLIAIGRTEEGLRRLDEVMVLVTSDPRVSPQVVGLMYCAAIEAFRRCFDHGRAREWTDALSRWSARQPGLVAYRGQCLVHRAEILQLHGLWADASAEMERVFLVLGEDPMTSAAAMAHYQRGELHRLRGEVEAAHAAYGRARERGRDPQPGLALLRAAQGEVEVAFRALQRAVEEAKGAHDRLVLLPAFVEVAIAAGRDDVASRAAAELHTAATDRPVPLLQAAAAHAQAQAMLARGDGAAALGLLREALAAWQQLAAPYEAAQTRIDLALACRMLDDEDTADLELAAARRSFVELGARPAVERVDALARRPATIGQPGGLTVRECQVLRLVATGATNRAIAGELFLSEKTVARHVANIFIKLGVSSRTAATAFAYEQRLV